MTVRGSIHVDFHQIKVNDSSSNDCKGDLPFSAIMVAKVDNGFSRCLCLKLPSYTLVSDRSN